MRGDLTFLGYRFVVEVVTQGERELLVFTPLNPATPEEVMAELYKTVNQHLARMREDVERLSKMSLDEIIKDSGWHL